MRKKFLLVFEFPVTKYTVSSFPQYEVRIRAILNIADKITTPGGGSDNMWKENETAVY